jgi:hypothetical protein
MTAPRVGEFLRCRRTGETYMVERTGGERVILRSLDGLGQILTEKQVLAMSYEALSQLPPPAGLKVGQ